MMLFARRLALVLFACVIAASPRAHAAEVASWPHTVTGDDGSATIYTPQAISWPDLHMLTARAAVAITPKGASAPFFGTIELSVTTDAELGTRTVTLTAPKLISTNFPTLDAEHVARLEERVRALMATLPPKEIPLDTVLLSLKQPPPTPDLPVKNDPPRIFYAQKPASLLVFDGAPLLAPIAGTGLSFAVNTNWDVLKDGAGHWYLLNNGTWFTAPDATGPWSVTTSLPADFTRVPADENFAALRRALPARAPAAGAPVPTILVSTEPAEIIVTEGAPKLAPIAGTSLQRVTNTAATLLFDPESKQFFVLLSGRWFAAASLDGPWHYATPSLPASFASIPATGPVGAVLPSVPGTPQAEEAVIQAQIPHQATLKRSASITIVYGGPPRFAPIPGMSIEYAVNTHSDVLKIGNEYYACVNGAWFRATSPTGPWTLAESVPQAVAAIPPASPLYRLTFVHVYAVTPVAITYGYTAGYVMAYPVSGVVVYGTGYYYPPVIIPGPVPAYYPYPYSYAGSVWYNPATGAWARGGAVYGPYGAARAGYAYNPTTGAWAGGAAVYGPYGGAGAWSAYNPSTGSYAHGSAVWGGGSGTANASWYNARTGVSGTTNQNVNPYGRWGSSTLTGPNATVNTASGSNARGSAGGFSSSTGAAGAGVHGNNGRNAGVARGANGDVYAGADGNVYRHTSDGWSKYDNGSWTPVQKPNNTGPRSGANGTNTANNSGSLGSTAPTNTRPNGGTRTPPNAGQQTRTRGTSSSSYGQLEQDRQARRGGAFGSGNGGAGGGRFGGGRFGGGEERGGFERGGGRFR